MGRFRQRMFNLPNLGNKVWQMGNDLSLANLYANGWATGAGTGQDAWQLPLLATEWAILDQMVVGRVAAITAFNERRFAWDAAAVPSYYVENDARRLLTSVIFKYNCVGFDPAGSITPCNDSLLLNGWSIGDNFNLSVNWGGANWQLTVSHSGGMTFNIALVDPLDAFNNTIKVNLTRTNDGTKRCDAWIYDTSTAAWLTGNADENSQPNSGNEIYCGMFFPGGNPTQTLDSTTSFVGLEYLQVASTDLSLVGHVPVR